MTKAEIQRLCEADDQLQWWAMILFAEISQLEDNREQAPSECTEADTYRWIRLKVREFDRLVVKRSLEKAEETLSLEQRVAALEKAVGIRREST